jgi:hypothetical protein
MSLYFVMRAAELVEGVQTHPPTGKVRHVSMLSLFLLIKQVLMNVESVGMCSVTNTAHVCRTLYKIRPALKIIGGGKTKTARRAPKKGRKV